MLTDWVQTRKKILTTGAVELLRSQRTVGVVAGAMEAAGMPEPDSAHFAERTAYLQYIAVGDEPRRRDLGRRARRMLDVKETTFAQHYVGGQQTATTEGMLGGVRVMVTVVLGMRANCHLEYEDVTTKRAKVVCD